mgnify:CR=1 FL=1
MTSTDVRADLDRVDAILAAAGLPGRPDWPVVKIRREHHDERPVTVVRFQAVEYRLGAPHLTVVHDDEGTLLGYTDLTPRPGDLPNVERARQVATEFFQRVDAEYAAGLTELWIDRHEETVETADGKASVAGMKVKNAHRNGRYAWAIVGPDDRIITYERDIVWNGAAARRATQMWLHDSWIAAHDGFGPPPAPPYAPVA